MLLLSFLLLTIGFIIYVAFGTLRTSIETSLIQNYATYGSMYHEQLSQKMKSYDMNSQYIANNPEMREAMSSYQNTTLTFSALQSVLIETYTKNVQELENVAVALRFSPDMTILTDYLKHEKYTETQLLTLDTSERSASSSLELFDAFVLYKTLIPIRDSDGTLLGYDFMIYDMTSIFSNFHINHMNFYLLCPPTICEASNAAFIFNLEEVYREDSIRILQNDETYYTLVPTVSDLYLVAESSEDDIFHESSAQIQYLMQQTLLEILLLFAITMIIVFFISKRQINKAENRGNSYKKLAYLDTLTGCYNRRFLEHWISHLRARDKNYTLLLFDLDNMKTINDTYGHIKGDIALHSVAEAMQEVAQAHDYVIRYGGDEFAMILEDTSELRISEISQFLQMYLKETKENHPFAIKLSSGSSLLSSDKSFEIALEEADQHLYNNKKNNKKS